MIRNGGRYASVLLGAGALWWLAHQGVFPQKNPLRPKEYLLWEQDLNRHGWANLFNRRDVILCLTWFFVTAGPTTTLPADFNTASNQVNCIGNGAGGSGGFPGTAGGGCPCGTNGIGGGGGNGGGAGAFAQIVNYSAHGAGAVVNVNFSGDVWFDSTSVVLAKSASGQTGGAVSGSVGITKFSGGNGGNAQPPLLNAFGGPAGGGGGAGGPHGQGNNGGDAITASDTGGAGATADAGNTPAGGNGTQFDATHGSGGGGSGADATINPGATGATGNNGGRYGGGGGGGGGGAGGAAGGGAGGNGGNGGNAFQGLIAISYTPAGGGGGTTPRSFGVFIT